MMYDEKELKRIISRAIQLQRDAGEGYGGQPQDAQEGSRLSQQELEEIAQDAGLSSTYMRQAIAEFEGLPLEESFFVDTFNKNYIELIGFAPGPMTPANWPELRSAVEKRLGAPGITRRGRESMEWEARPKGISKLFKTQKEQYVRIENSSRKLKIKLRKNVRTQRIPELPGWALILVAMAFVVMMFQTGDAAPLFGVVVASGLASVFFSWADGRKLKARKQLNDLMLEMQNILTRHEAGRAPGEEKQPAQNTAEKNSAGPAVPEEHEQKQSYGESRRLKNNLQH